MKKILLTLLLLAFLLLAYISKPDDRTCIIQTVERVWGDYVPDVDTKPQYYEQFMDLQSKEVVINDWIFLKRIRYRTNDDLLGFGLFKQVVFF